LVVDVLRDNPGEGAGYGGRQHLAGGQRSG
jgi:hypothetical protein